MMFDYGKHKECVMRRLDGGYLLNGIRLDFLKACHDAG